MLKLPTRSLIAKAAAILACLFVAACDSGGGSGSQPPPAPPPPAGPSADAGPDIVAAKFADVELSGGGSSNASSFSWEQISGPSTVLLGADTETLSFQARSLGEYVFRLSVAGNSQTATDEVTVLVQEQPSVQPIAPLLGGALATTQGSLDFTVRINGTVTEIDLSNETNGHTQSLVGAGEGEVVFEDVPLVDGDNEIVIEARDGLGNNNRIEGLVIFSEEVVFFSSVSITETVALTGATLDQVVRIAVGGAIGPVELVLFNGGEETSLTPLLDNGDFENGDDISGDDVYSAQFQLTVDQAGDYQLRVRAEAASGATVLSPPLDYIVTDPWADGEIAALDLRASELLEETVPNVGTELTPQDFVEFQDALVAAFQNEPGVVSVEVSQTGEGILIVYENRYRRFVQLRFRSGDDPTLGGAPQWMRTERRPVQPIQTSAPELRPLSLSIEATSAADPVIGSNLAIALAPYLEELGRFDTADEVWPRIVASRTPDFQEVAFLADQQVTVESFKNMNYGLILINSHGNEFGVIATTDELTEAKEAVYQPDIAAGRLSTYTPAIFDIGAVDDLLTFLGIEATPRLLVWSGFIRHYNSNLPNSLVLNVSCSGAAAGNPMINAFLSSGAATYLSYDDTVFSSFAERSVDAFLEAMIDQAATVDDALAYSYSTAGADDGGNTPAALVRFGEGDLTLEAVGIQNGGFEEGLNFWITNGGDARVISRLSTIQPQEGQRMAIISSGLGSVTDSDSIISQGFKVPQDAGTLRLRYDVVSEEPLEYVGSTFDDKFEVFVLFGEDFAQSELIAFESINTSSWSATQGDDSDGGLFPGGDGTAFRTGWKEASFDLSSFRGQRVRIRLRVFDVGDSRWDTAALLDDARIE